MTGFRPCEPVETEIVRKIDTLTALIRNLTREVREQKTLFVRGMTAVKRSFEMVRKTVNCLADSVGDFSELTGVLGDF